MTDNFSQVVFVLKTDRQLSRCRLSHVCGAGVDIALHVEQALRHHMVKKGGWLLSLDAYNASTLPSPSIGESFTGHRPYL